MNEWLPTNILFFLLCFYPMTPSSMNVFGACFYNEYGSQSEVTD
ncbi:hypothetical protein SVXHx_1616 [Haloferax volcanii]|nr:hypothetical protein SVXHx_1616 [Haloferax lucentense]